MDESRKREQVLFTVPEVAQLLKVSEVTIRRLIRDLKLDVVRVGRSVRVESPALDRYLDGICGAPSQQSRQRDWVREGRSGESQPMATDAPGAVGGEPDMVFRRRAAMRNEKRRTSSKQRTKYELWRDPVTGEDMPLYLNPCYEPCRVTRRLVEKFGIASLPDWYRGDVAGPRLSNNWAGDAGFFRFVTYVWDEMEPRPSEFHWLHPIIDKLGYTEGNLRWFFRMPTGKRRRRLAEKWIAEYGYIWREGVLKIPEGVMPPEQKPLAPEFSFCPCTTASFWPDCPCEIALNHRYVEGETT